MDRTIFDVAYFFLKKNGGKISSKKMQKLCYYAQAWSYALRDKRLFNGRFCAWVHGPVNILLWNMFMCDAYRDITVKDFKKRRICPKQFNKEELAFLERVWETYGELNGYQLELLTQSEDPWIKARKGLDQYKNGTRYINESAMKAYYRSIYIQEEKNT